MSVVEVTLVNLALVGLIPGVYVTLAVTVDITAVVDSELVMAVLIGVDRITTIDKVSVVGGELFIGAVASVDVSPIVNVAAFADMDLFTGTVLTVVNTLDVNAFVIFGDARVVPNAVLSIVVVVLDVAEVPDRKLGMMFVTIFLEVIKLAVDGVLIVDVGNFTDVVIADVTIPSVVVILDMNEVLVEVGV
ncbi:hypothetical protein ACJMK2_013715 [Sinanodonta woodiana]|uniref:Uncharacterized protein n=1 Tax=Sinanodonta woodiana TaxID=1069815 RepID=A0ABD3UYC5_SINWO